MGLAFESLWALALIPLGLAAVWLIDRRYRVRRRSLRRRVTLCVRLLLCLVLALAVAGPSVPEHVGRGAKVGADGRVGFHPPASRAGGGPGQPGA